MPILDAFIYAVAVVFTVYAVRQMINREWSRTLGLSLIFAAVLVPFGAFAIMGFFYFKAVNDKAHGRV